MSRHLRLRLAALVTIATGVLATGCGSDAASTDPVEGRKVRVTTTTNFITDTVRQVGGDRVEVQGLMGPGVDPHLYKASAGDVRKLRDADVIIYGGLQLEGKMGDLLEDLAERQTTVAITKDIPREELLDPPANVVGEQYDPHVWFDVEKWIVAAGTVAAALKEKDPEHAATYEANLARYTAELREADAYVEQQIAKIPKDRRLLVTSHDAFEYFGKRYGMEVAAIQGISTASEATTSDVRRVAALLAARKIPAAFIESSVPRQTIEAVLAAAKSRGHTARIGGELYTDAAGDEGTVEGTYVGMVRANADTITEALSR